MRNITEHPYYITWQSIKRRCYNTNTRDYKYYGGRGITVCDDWLWDSRAFCDYMDTLPPRQPGESIDRIDTNGNYSPGNVRWQCQADQIRNRRPFTRVSINSHGYKWVTQRAGTTTYWGRFSSKGTSYVTPHSYPTAKECYDAVIIMRQELGLPIQTWTEMELG